MLTNRIFHLSIGWLLNSLAYSIIYPFIPIYLHEERNLPMDQVGMIFPLMGLAIIVTPPFSGVLADRIGRRFLMQFGQTSRAGMFLLLAALAYWNAPFWIFAVGLMINAGIGTFFQVGADAYLADISTPEERTHAYSKIRIGTNIGWAVGPMLGAFLARTPFALMFVMTALLCIFGARYTGWCCPTEPARNAAARAAEADGSWARRWANCCGTSHFVPHCPRRPPADPDPRMQFPALPAHLAALLGDVGLRHQRGRHQP